ncbi:MAG: ATP-binding protein [Bacteroidetes bacterium]|nr:ATP-binding protein [Bacteroidota bacterium]
MQQLLYSRYVGDQIKSWLYKGKVIILYGARQVGKTTLVKEIMKDIHGSLYLNCETNQVHEILESRNMERIYTYIGNAKLVVFDEAQKIKEIGLVLKLIHDTWPEIQCIATGSSSFDLLNELSEPLTGRNIKLMLYPLSFSELKKNSHVSVLDERLEGMLRYGMYPDVVDRPESEKIVILEELASDYLFRDAFRFENLKHPETLNKLLQALALQLGNEVSLREVSRLLKASVDTIQHYLAILERSFILFRISSFSRNLRKELAKSQKFYFFDLGLRNSLIRNFNILSNRNDTGALWENFCIVERIKANQMNQRKANLYFWRTYDQKEIDLIEETQGKLFAFEFKYNPEAKIKKPLEFLQTYPESEFQVIHRENYYSFIS